MGNTSFALQMWAWERLDVTRPDLRRMRLPLPVDMTLLSGPYGQRWGDFSLSWADDRVPHSSGVNYRNEFDNMQPHQVLIK